MVGSRWALRNCVTSGVVIALGFIAAACIEGPISEPVPPPLRPEFQTVIPGEEEPTGGGSQPSSSTATIYVGPDGFEYESDTGALACPNPLRSNVQYPVDISNVGTKWFTFYAPHRRLEYLKLGKYRYEMNYGQSYDGDWMAEGNWDAYCLGSAARYIGTPVAFHGTVWYVGTIAWDPSLGEPPGPGADWCGYKVWTDLSDECGDAGTGGGGEGGAGSDTGGDGGGGAGHWICDEFKLEPGCYDVYIDYEYAGVICC